MIEEMKKNFVLGAKLGIVAFVLCIVAFILKKPPSLLLLILVVLAWLVSNWGLRKRIKRIREKLKNENPESQRKILGVYDEIKETIGQVVTFAIGVYILSLIVTSWHDKDGITVEMLKTGFGVSKLEVQKLFSVILFYVGYYNVRFIFFSNRKKLDDMSREADIISKKLIFLFRFASVFILLIGFLFSCLSFRGYDDYWWLPWATVVFSGHIIVSVIPVLSEMIK